MSGYFASWRQKREVRREDYGTVHFTGKNPALYTTSDKKQHVLYFTNGDKSLVSYSAGMRIVNGNFRQFSIFLLVFTLKNRCNFLQMAGLWMKWNLNRHRFFCSCKIFFEEPEIFYSCVNTQRREERRFVCLLFSGYLVPVVKVPSGRMTISAWGG